MTGRHINIQAINGIYDALKHVAGYIYGETIGDQRVARSVVES